MEKTVKKLLSLVWLSCLLMEAAQAQAKSGIESYNLVRPAQGYMWMPVIHYTSAKGYHAEVRYNYEEENTFSIFAGKVFSGGNRLKYDITPMAGLSAGLFSGFSLACNFNAESRKIFISLQSQYSMQAGAKGSSFFFNWSEAGIKTSEKTFLGTAFQCTLQSGANRFEPGLFAGFSIGELSVPVYFFYSKDGSSVIAAIVYEFSFRKR